MSTTLRLFLLGSPRIERDGDAVRVDTRKAVALLAYLAVSGQPQSRESLAELLWPEYGPDRSRASLRRTLSAVNRALGPGWLVTDRDTVRVDPTAWIDVEDFHAALNAAKRVPGRRLTRLTEAVSLYRADFLSSFALRDSAEFDDWQFYTAESLRRDLADALEQLTRGCVAVGDLSAAMAHARRWLSLDPLHEPAHRELMSLYTYTGRRSAALRQYRECVRALERELGVAPLEETEALYRAIREERLPSPFASGATDDSPAPRRQSPEDADRPAPATEPRRLPLVGRDAEWSALRAAHANAGDGRVAVLQGEVGIGKTRLVEELTAAAAAEGATTVAVRCFVEERALAYGPFVELLRALIQEPTTQARLSDADLPAHWWQEAARLLPEIGGRARRSPESETVDASEAAGGQTRLFDAVSGLVLAACTGPPASVIALDDVHWADEASIDLLAYLLRRLEGTPLCLLLTWRDDELPSTHRLARAVREIHATSATVLSLERLGRDDVDRLVEEARPSADAALRTRLYAETEGVPFFVVEYLAVLPADPVPDWPLPTSVRDLLTARVEGLDDAARQLLTAAAVIGRSFDVDTLRHVSGRGEEETIVALEELLARGLIREQPTDTFREVPYDFSHKLLREHVYTLTSLARRRLLHHRAAAALLDRTRRGRDTAALQGHVAQHYQRAGEDALAAQHYAHAGEAARATHAHAEAIDHFRAAIGLGHPDAPALHEAIGDLHTLAGSYDAAVRSYEAAAALSAAPLVDPAPLASLEHKLGTVHHRLGAWDSAEAHFTTALELLGANGGSRRQGLRSRALADWSLTAHHRGQPQRARELAGQALALAEEANDRQAIAQANNLLGILATRDGDPATARSHLERSLALADDEDVQATVAALNNLSLALAAEGDIEQALPLARAALERGAVLGDRHREAMLESNLADLLHRASCDEEAEQRMRRCAALLADVGADGEELRPEIWRLVEW